MQRRGRIGATVELYCRNRRPLATAHPASPREERRHPRDAADAISSARFSRWGHPSSGAGSRISVIDL
jgi:hypothetical protein